MDKKNWLTENTDGFEKRPAAEDDTAKRPVEETDGSPSTFRNKTNMIVIAGMVLLILALLVIAPKAAPRTEAEEEMVVITVGDKEYARVPLSQPQKLTIRQDNGAVNVVEVTEDGMRMVSSTCDNQICVHVGTVTLTNWELKPQQQFIHCAPNQVKLELTWPDE